LNKPKKYKAGIFFERFLLKPHRLALLAYRQIPEAPG
jgi:hypothetical protein